MIDTYGHGRSHNSTHTDNNSQSQLQNQSELFIVEGPHAANAVGQVLSREKQSVFPMQGKVPNAARQKSTTSLLANEAIQRLLVLIRDADDSSVGCFPTDSARYRKLIILCDPDADGLHARALLILLFCMKMESLVSSNRVFVVTPPLFSFSASNLKQRVMAYTPTHQQRVMQKLQEQNFRHIDCQRYKGLASMDSDLLASECVAPATRQIRQVTVADGESVAQVLARR